MAEKQYFYHILITPLLLCISSQMPNIAGSSAFSCFCVSGGSSQIFPYFLVLLFILFFTQGFEIRRIDALSVSQSIRAAILIDPVFSLALSCPRNTSFIVFSSRHRQTPFLRGKSLDMTPSVYHIKAHLARLISDGFYLLPAQSPLHELPVSSRPECLSPHSDAPQSTPPTPFLRQPEAKG